jgi:hypothetical protein
MANQEPAYRANVGKSLSARVRDQYAAAVTVRDVMVF